MASLAWVDAFLRAEGLPPGYRALIERVHAPLAARIAERLRSGHGRAAGPAGASHRPFVVGLCGPQGSGKSTLVASLRHLLQERALHVAVLSLDDLYLTRAERAALAHRVHPLLATRGVPGTHDVALGLEVIRRLGGPGAVALPAFDKARDERRPDAQWPRVTAPVDLLLFEGWCVGARPQPDEALAAPVNALEREEDPDGRWRRYVNAALAGPYQALFATIDELVLLAAPGFDAVYGWRLQQERKLRERLARFIQLFERLTRYILAEMPGRAHVVIPVQRCD